MPHFAQKFRALGAHFVSLAQRARIIAARLARRAAPRAPESPERSRVINQILELNPGASPLFLAQFSRSALGDYLEHLAVAAMPRRALARRERPENSPGILSRAAGA